MSQAREDRLAGILEAQQSDGETVTFRDADLTVTINRGLDAPAIEQGQVDFTERSKSHVEALISDVIPAPRVGEDFEDEDGMFHRIKVVRRTDLTYFCDCEIGDTI